MENDVLKKVLDRLQKLCDQFEIDDKTRANLLAVVINSYMMSKQEEVFLTELDNKMLMETDDGQKES